MILSSQPELKDVWQLGGAYESFIGRWSRPVAVRFLKWLAVPSGRKWLDVGCGTGMLTRTILEHADPVSVLGIDPAPGFISFAQKHTPDPRASFEVGSAESLSLEPGSFNAIVSGLVLNFVPDTERAVAAMRRATKPDGIVAAYVWDYAGKMELLRYFWDAALLLDRQAAMLDEGKRFPLCNPDKLRELFTSQGLKNVDVREIDVPTHFRNFDDLWSPFLSGQGPAPSYVASLTKERQTALREKLRAAIPVDGDGTIHLIARAWAVRGDI